MQLIKLESSITRWVFSHDLIIDSAIVTVVSYDFLLSGYVFGATADHWIGSGPFFARKIP